MELMPHTPGLGPLPPSKPLKVQTIPLVCASGGIVPLRPSAIVLQACMAVAWCQDRVARRHGLHDERYLFQVLMGYAGSYIEGFRDHLAQLRRIGISVRLPATAKRLGVAGLLVKVSGRWRLTGAGVALLDEVRGEILREWLVLYRCLGPSKVMQKEALRSLIELVGGSVEE